MATLTEIETKTAAYKMIREVLAGAVGGLEEEMLAAKKKYLPKIRKAVEIAKQRQAELRTAIEASPDLFVKPRTLIIDGVRVGYMKDKGSIEWDAEEKVVERIQRLLPKDQAELLIRVKKNVHKPGVYDLTASDLKRLGIRIEGAGDKVVIKDAAGEVDKLVEALLKEGTQETEEQS